MTVVLVALATLVVVVIALVAVGTVVGRLGTEPARNVYEGDEALEFVAQSLTDTRTAALSYDDVARVMRLHLDFLHDQGVARSGGDLDRRVGVHVVDPNDAADYVVSRAALVDFHPGPDVVADILAAHLAYFEAIGVVDPVTGPDLDAVEAELADRDEATGERPNA